MHIAKVSSTSVGTNALPTAPIPDDLKNRPIKLTDNARTVLQKRYLRRGEDGKIAENEHQMFWRVAYHVALAEREFADDDTVMAAARDYFELLTNLHFFPNSPTFTGAGTPLGQLAACFVLKIDDDMGRVESGIFQALRDAALIQQTGGGNGFAFSRLRPKGAIVKSSGGEATGPLGFLRVYDQAFGEIAQGGCLTPDTLVFTDSGTLRLDEIVRHEQPGWVDHALTVATDEGRRVSPHAYNNGVVPVLRVVTSEGIEITGTPNHKVKIMTQDGPAWRRLDELQPGDALLVKLGEHRGTLQALRQPEKTHGNQIMPQFPPVLDEEFAFFMGYMAGDGFVASGEDDHRIGVTVAHSSYLYHEMPALMGRIFGTHLTVHCQQKPNDASVTYTFDNRAIKDFLAVNGLVKGRSINARVPRLIRQSTPEVVGAYLRGLFEADGALSHGYPMLVSTSQVLLREVATLLIGLGCPITMRQQETDETHYGTNDLWTLRINSFVGLKAWQAKISCDPRSRFVEIAQPTPELVLAGQPIPAGIVRSHTESAEHARPVNDLWFVQVESVQAAGESLTLDIEVEGNHTYLANGIVTHNSRRGANMAVLQVDHPDVMEFVTCKTDESHITNFNISIGITDAFMQAVEADTDFDLINPQNGKVWRTVRARDLFDLIVKQAHHNGEPGVLFLDEANRHNPVPHLYTLESTNPCGEQFLGPFENCCLGSINLAKLDLKKGKLDWAMLQQMVETSTRFLDDVVNANSYVPAVPQLAEAAHRVRRIGLGIMGLADLMYKLGVRYGSEEGQEFAGQVMEFVRYHAMKVSVELAKERGAFPAIEGSIYDPANLKWQPPAPLFPYSRDWGRPKLDWSKIVKGIKKHGIRNGAQTTVAPTGTIATVSGCEGYGCEPVFALAYIRHVNDKGQDLKLQYTSPLFEKALKDAKLSEAQISKIIDHVNMTGNCQDAPGLPEKLRHTFVVSSDVSVDEHIHMQAALQRFTDNAISKTINAPNNSTEEDVAKAYMLGWKLGCKGLTVYVTGSREKVVLETHATAKAKQESKTEATALITPTIPDAGVIPVEHEHNANGHAEVFAEIHTEMEPQLLIPEAKKPRPRRLEGRTYRVGTPLGGAYITINENGKGKGHPFELFIHTSKAGSETAAISEALGRLSSLILRIASPIPPRDRVKEIIKQLEGIGGERSIGFGAARVRSLPDGIAQVLREYLDETAEVEGELIDEPDMPSLPARTVPKQQMALKIGDLCPECGEASVVNEEGCRKCYNCGYSEC